RCQLKPRSNVIALFGQLHNFKSAYPANPATPPPRFVGLPRDGIQIAEPVSLRQRVTIAGREPLESLSGIVAIRRVSIALFRDTQDANRRHLLTLVAWAAVVGGNEFARLEAPCVVVIPGPPGHRLMPGAKRR